jgi:hypothetical protein
MNSMRFLVGDQIVTASWVWVLLTTCFAQEVMSLILQDEN